MIVTEPIVYEAANSKFEGTISWDTSQTGPRPGVMIAPTFKGQSGFETQKAELLAELGYVGFAIDIYGQGKRATTPEAASALMAVLNDDRSLLLKHMQLATTTIRQLPQVDEKKIAAIGFCFGGKCVLDLARSGIDIRAVVSFHGIYDPPPLATATKITAAVLVLHGWEDPLAPREQTVALADELTQYGADWQIHMFGHTAHAFTNPQAQDRASGMFFNSLSAERGWKMMQDFLQAQFA
ncbi:MAG: Dienelactone hydrolase-related protein [Phormidesmis priestleyi Ana]|uniref:Dienelactone hydrolase-related protein n=1 Tax=Phormidesmis priestleyi Ana TaxID=1666911 RepID=A0A0P7ZPC7_9CYAN|nr:MAG: Dienelactone hydrolase-related protein [Phormidesmis priestleyi Ana]